MNFAPKAFTTVSSTTDADRQRFEQQRRRRSGDERRGVTAESRRVECQRNDVAGPHEQVHAAGQYAVAKTLHQEVHGAARRGERRAELGIGIRRQAAPPRRRSQTRATWRCRPPGPRRRESRRCRRQPCRRCRSTRRPPCRSGRIRDWDWARYWKTWRSPSSWFDSQLDFNTRLTDNASKVRD